MAGKAQFGETAGDGTAFPGVDQRGKGLVLDRSEEVWQGRIIDRPVDLPFGKSFDPRAFESVGTEHPGFSRHEDRRHLEAFGDGAGVERPRAAEGEEGVGGGIGSLADRDRADRVGHLFDREIEEPLEEGVIGCIARDSRLLLQGQGRVAGGGEIRSGEGNAEVFGVDPAQQEIHIGDRERTTESVAGRAGRGAGGFGSNAEAAIFPTADRSAARCDRLDAQGRSENTGVANALLEVILESTVVAGHVRARAPHIEGEDSGIPQLLRDRRRARDTTGGTGEERILRPELLHRLEPARTCHHEEPAPVGKALAMVIDKGLHHRLQGRVGQGGLKAGEDLHERGEFGAGRDMGETERKEAIAQGDFVHGIPVAVKERDGGDGDA